MSTCKKCVMNSDYPGISFDEDGICQLCRDISRPYRGIPESQKVASRADFEKTLKAIKGKYSYDAVLTFSGGKDSAYMAHQLREQYGLRLLLFNVKNRFGTKLGGDNVAELAKKLDMPLVTFEWPVDFSRSFYQYFFLHPLRQGLTATVCRVCQTLLQSAAVKLAKREGIPLILHGFSPFQVAENWHYEIRQETLLKAYGALGNFWEDVDIAPEILDRFHFASDADNEPWPRILLPLHVMDCPTEVGIRKRLEELDLLSYKRTSPRKTNCDHSWLMAYLDTLHFGEPPCRDWVSEKIRMGEGNRSKFLLEMKGFSLLCRTRLFRPFFVRRTLKKLGLTEKEVLHALSQSEEDEAKYQDVYMSHPNRHILEAKS